MAAGDRHVQAFHRKVAEAVKGAVEPGETTTAIEAAGNGGGPADELRIGVKLKHARKVRRLVLKDLASRVGCSESLLSKIENDKVQPSLQMLHRIVTALGTSIGAMFSGEKPDADIVMRRGQRPLLNIDAIKRSDSQGVQLEMLAEYGELLFGSIHIVDPGGGSDGLIMHEGEEVGYVLQGEVELVVGDRRFNLKKEDSFFFKSDLPHGYRNCGSVVAKILWVNTPSTF